MQETNSKNLIQGESVSIDFIANVIRVEKDLHGKEWVEVKRPEGVSVIRVPINQVFKLPTQE